MAEQDEEKKAEMAKVVKKPRRNPRIRPRKRIKINKGNKGENR